jgi:protein-S-isoprenylcysteine O-methyltransferase Ste14
MERVIVAAWIGFELLKALQLVWAGGVALGDYLVLASMAVLLANTLRRPAPVVYRADWQTLLPCLVSLSITTIAFTLIAPASEPNTVTAILEFASAALMLWAALSLGTSFTMLPAAIAPVRRGAYGLLRHPLYAAYLLYDIALGVQFQSWVVWLAIAAEAAAFAIRARQEERLLSAQFPDYQAYQREVRGSFIPYIF